jgi:polygalacturonase
VNIKDFGAVSGGQVLNSQAFADAIEAVSQKVVEKLLFLQESGLQVLLF